jgi:hypothetical protein
MSEKIQTAMWTSRVGANISTFTLFGRCVAIYTGVEDAIVTTLFLVSFVGSSTRGLMYLEVA